VILSILMAFCTIPAWFSPGPPPDFEDIGRLKAIAEYYDENVVDTVHGDLVCKNKAQHFSWWCGQVGYNVSWRSIRKTEYNKMFDRITFPKDQRIDNHYINSFFVGDDEYYLDIQTGEIVRTGDWAVVK